MRRAPARSLEALGLETRDDFGLLEVRPERGTALWAPTTTPMAPIGRYGSPLAGAIVSNSKSPRALPDQSCSAAVSMSSASLVRGALDRLVAARRS